MARLRVVRCGSVGQVWQGAVRCSTEWLDKAGGARRGNVALGVVRISEAGGAAQGIVRWRAVRQVWQGSMWFAQVR